MAVPVWALFTRDLHGFVPEVSQPVAVKEEGGCMRKAKTKTQGEDGEKYGLLDEGSIKAEYALISLCPLPVPSDPGVL